MLVRVRLIPAPRASPLKTDDVALAHTVRDMVVEITLDDRESALCDALGALVADPANVRVHPPRRMVLGDAHLAADGLEILVERKRQDDLMSSLFDGRLRDQYDRLHAWQRGAHAGDPPPPAPEQRWVVVVIEGECPSPAAHARYSHRFHLKTMLTCHVEALAHPRSFAMRTHDVHETALLLLTLHKTVAGCGALLEGHGEPAGRWAPPPAAPRGADVFRRQLCCVPGVSHTRAARIQTDLFPTMLDLARAVERDGEVAIGARIGQAIGSRSAGRALVRALVTAPSSGRGAPADDAPNASLPRKRARTTAPQADHAGGPRRAGRRAAPAGAREARPLRRVCRAVRAAGAPRPRAPGDPPHDGEEPPDLRGPGAPGGAPGGGGPPGAAGPTPGPLRPPLPDAPAHDDGPPGPRPVADGPPGVVARGPVGTGTGPSAVPPE